MGISGGETGLRVALRRIASIVFSLVLVAGTMAPGFASAAADSSTGDAGSSAESSESTNTLEALYLFYENYEKPSKPRAYNPKVSPTITEQQGSMELYAQSEFTSGNIGWVSDTGVGVVWSIEETFDVDGEASDKDIASIDRADGTVKALGQGNGSVTVRCTAQDYDVHSDMTVYIKGNSGVPYVTGLKILNKDGSALSADDEVRIESDDFGLETPFYAKVAYTDPVTGETSTKNTKNGDTVANINWSSSGDSKVAYVNEDTGVLVAQATGTVRLTCSIIGGGKLGDTITAYITVLCGGDTLDPDRDYTPADELKVVVKYEKEDKENIGSEEDYETARTWYYSPDELESLGTTENLYTLVKGDGNWATMKAHGIYFDKLLESQDLDRDEIKGFYFGATDDYNPGFVGCGWLYKKRYYYPNMSIGSGKLGAEQVAPMIATETIQQDLVDEPVGELSDQTRFRLCLGAESTTDNNAQKSIYNVHTITVILEGAPKVQWETPGTGSATSRSGDTGGNGDGDGGGSESGGIESDGGNGSAGGDPTGSNTSSGNEEPSEKPTNGSGGTTRVNATESADASTASDASSADRAENASGGTAVGADAQVTARQDEADTTQAAEQTDAAADEKRWEAYEIMSRSKANVAALATDSPFAPLVIPALLLVAIVGGVWSGLSFRRARNPLARRRRGDGSGATRGVGILRGGRADAAS